LQVTLSGVVFWQRIVSVIPPASVPHALVTALSTAALRVPEAAFLQTVVSANRMQTSHSTGAIRVLRKTTRAMKTPRKIREVFVVRLMTPVTLRDGAGAVNFQ
jgi:hypothetical protein